MFNLWNIDLPQSQMNSTDKVTMEFHEHEHHENENRPEEHPAPVADAAAPKKEKAKRKPKGVVAAVPKEKTAE